MTMRATSQTRPIGTPWFDGDDLVRPTGQTCAACGAALLERLESYGAGHAWFLLACTRCGSVERATEGAAA